MQKVKTYKISRKFQRRDGISEKKIRWNFKKQPSPPRIVIQMKNIFNTHIRTYINERTSEFINRSIKFTQVETQNTASKAYGIILYSLTYAKQNARKRRKKENRGKNYEAVIAINFPKLVTYIKLQIHETQGREEYISNIIYKYLYYICICTY